MTARRAWWCRVGDSLLSSGLVGLLWALVHDGLGWSTPSLAVGLITNAALREGWARQRAWQR